MKPDGSWTYETDCVGCPGPDAGDALQIMVNGARQITRATFLRYVFLPQLYRVEKALGYELHARRGLTMARDFHVAYFRSTFRDRPCVYFVHSAIEHIFTDGGRGEIASAHLARHVARTRR